MPDGTLIQWGFESVTVTQSNEQTITFPIPFVGTIPVVTNSTGAGSLRTPMYIESVGLTSFGVVRINAASAGGSWCRWIAIGRWK